MLTLAPDRTENIAGFSASGNVSPKFRPIVKQFLANPSLKILSETILEDIPIDWSVVMTK